MNKQNALLKTGLVLFAALVFAYLIFYKPAYNLILAILTIFSPDGVVQAHTVLKFYFIILLDFIIIIFLFYYLQKYKKLSSFWNMLVAGIIAEIFLVQLVFTFDRSYCGAETYFLKWPQTIQLLLASFFAYKNFGINKGKIRTFWLFVSLAFLYATLDELFTVHEQLAEMLFSNTIIDAVYPYLLDSIVILFYFIAAVAFLFYFYKPFYEKYKHNRWLYVFILALIIHAYAVFADVIAWECSEEYAESFASLFYFMSFLFAYLNGKKRSNKKKRKWLE